MLVDSYICIFTGHMYKGDFSELPGVFLAPDGKCSMSGVINALGTKKCSILFASRRLLQIHLLHFLDNHIHAGSSQTKSLPLFPV